MWIGELITERGIGNGISFIIFAGIVSQARGPSALSSPHPDIAASSPSHVVAMAAVGVIIYIQEGQRRIPISTPAESAGGGCTRAARRSCRCGSTRPASSRSSSRSASCCSPSSWRRTSRRRRSKFVGDVGEGGRQPYFSPNSIALLALFFLPTIGFTYFYTAFTFKPDETANQLRENGGFIPGIPPAPDPGLPRPSRHPDRLRRRPLPRRSWRSRRRSSVSSPRTLGLLGLGGTSLLIVVSVVVETMKQIEAQLMMRNYEEFIR